MTTMVLYGRITVRVRDVKIILSEIVNAKNNGNLHNPKTFSLLVSSPVVQNFILKKTKPSDIKQISANQFNFL